MQGLKSTWQTHMRRLAGPLAQRWGQMARRERLAVAALGLFLLALALYGGLWLPVERARLEALGHFERQRDLLAYLQTRAPEAQAASGRATAAVAPADLQRLVTAAAERQGLAIERLDAGSEDGIQLNLQPAPFATLLAWFESLERQGIRIEEAGLERHGEGWVTARLALRPAR